jgi:imidazolonepropionase-like amidohydrolase
LKDAALGTTNQPTLTVRSVRLFDGERVIPNASVAIADGVIAASGSADAIRAEGETIDGDGLTLLPGLIDAHVHAWGPRAKVLERNLLFGVTTALEMHCDGDGLTEANELRRSDPPHLAQLRSSGFAMTVSGGHGTEYGFSVPTLDRPEDAQAFVDVRIDAGADYIKVMYGEPRPGMPAMSKPLMQAAIHAAHRRGMKVAVHIVSMRAAREAIEAGADVLAHAFRAQPDQEIDDVVRLAAHYRVAVIPTLAVLNQMITSTSAAEFAADGQIAPHLTSFDRRSLHGTFAGLREQQGRPPMPAVPPELQPRLQAKLREIVTALRDAGVPLLAGTDAPNPGTTHGASIHHEIELLADAGVSPVEALASATSVPARCFDLRDRGRIAPGLRADLLLVRGDPTTDIKATRDIVGVWKAGVRLDRPAPIL